MSIEEIQDYFKKEIAIGHYKITERYQATFGGKRLWLSILVNDRPFVIEISPKGTVLQVGDITENYLQLGEFTNEQQRTIYEQYRNEIEGY